MPSTLSLLPKLTADFPSITFTPGKIFSWSPAKQTVFYNETDDQGVALLLHELSHGLLDHHDYQQDVELLAMEAAAWDKAVKLANTYGITLDEETAENHLDTYREWLHSRSTCPHCDATGYQTKKDTYTCVACSHTWRVNEARLCNLRRYSLTK